MKNRKQRHDWLEPIYTDAISTKADLYTEKQKRALRQELAERTAEWVDAIDERKEYGQWHKYSKKTTPRPMERWMSAEGT